MVVVGAAVVVGGGTVEDGLVELVSAAEVAVVADELAWWPTVLSPHAVPSIATPISSASDRTTNGTPAHRRLLHGGDGLAEDEVGDLAHLLVVLRGDDQRGYGCLLPRVEAFPDA